MTKYVVYKGTGGLFHNLQGLTTAIETVCSISPPNYTLIVDMKNHGAFGCMFKDYFTICCERLTWTDNYNDVPRAIAERVAHTSAFHHGYLNPRQGNHSRSYDIDLSSDVNVIYGVTNCHVSPCIKVNEGIRQEIARGNIAPPYMAVHFRNTDIKNNPHEFISTIQTALDEHTHIKTLYLATDNSEFYQLLRDHLSVDSVTILRNTIPAANIYNLHYGSRDKHKQMYESLQDVYHILRSTVFIPSMNSGFSRNIVHMINEQYTIFEGLVSDARVVKA